MSTEIHKTTQSAGQLTQNDDVSFESSDVQTKSILAYLMYLAIAVIVTFALCIYIFRYATNFAVQSHTPPPPVRQGVAPTMPPEPRLQGILGHETDAQQDLRNKVKEDTAANEKLGWIDEKAGIAQIPVKDAMKIIAEKGFPAVTTPPAEKKK
jgi:hypothetical protein